MLDQRKFSHPGEIVQFIHLTDLHYRNDHPFQKALTDALIIDLAKLSFLMFNPLVAAQEKTVEPKACSYGKAGVLLGTAEAEAGRMTEIV